MRHAFRWIFAALLIGSAFACGSKEVEVDMGSPQTEADQERLNALMQQEQEMTNAHMQLLRQNAGPEAPGLNPQEGGGPVQQP